MGLELKLDDDEEEEDEDGDEQRGMERAPMHRHRQCF